MIFITIIITNYVVISVKIDNTDRVKRMGSNTRAIYTHIVPVTLGVDAQRTAYIHMWDHYKMDESMYTKITLIK